MDKSTSSCEFVDSPGVERLLRLALEEDLPFGDITTSLTVPPGHRSHAEIYAKQELVLCGVPIVEKLFSLVDSDLELDRVASDGETLKPGESVARIRGATASLLSGERIALNILQRLSGIATRTREIVNDARNLVVCDTRKMTPGWRALEKYAVRTGGAVNHRFSLSDMILVKNNHIDAAQSNIRDLIANVMREKPLYMPVEVEVRNEEELQAALGASPDIIMLDNMDIKQMRDAVKTIRSHSSTIKIEVSGGVSTDDFAELRELNIDAVSMGTLVHGAVWKDLAMRIL